MISSYFVASVCRVIEKRYPAFTSGSPIQYDGSGSYATLASFTGMLLDLEEHVGQDSLGLKLGDQLAPSCFNLQGQLVMSCANLGEALPLVLRFHTLILPGSRIEMLEQGESVRFVWKMPDSKALPRVFSELIIASTCQFGAWITGGSTRIPRMGFSYSQPDSLDCYSERYGAVLSFDESHSFIEVPKRWAELEIKTASINLKPILSQHAQILLDEMDRRAGFQSRLEQLVEKMIGTGEPTIDRVAAQLGQSTRSLQRTLQLQGIRFSDLLKNVRERRAHYLLQSTATPITDIAMELGYQTSSAFSKAYKLWTGYSPMEVRKGRQLTSLANYDEQQTTTDLV